MTDTKGSRGRSARRSALALLAAVGLLLGLGAAGCGSPVPAPTRPPGGWIAFVNSGTGESGGIYLMNPDGSGVRRISAAVGPGVDWSPDGARLVFTSNPGISVMNADGSDVTRLTQAGEAPAWSPDGQRIVFALRPNEAPAGDPPDQAAIDRFKQMHLQIMNADGSGLVGLTHGPVADEWPSWSFDGTQIAFDRNPLPPFAEPGCSGTCLVIADGSAVSPLRTDGRHPEFTPDGLTVAYVSSVPGQSGIWLLDADGSTINLTPNMAQDAGDDFEYPAWSPDGRRLAFAYRPIGSQGNRQSDIYVVDNDGSHLTRLTQGLESVWGISWR